MADAWSTRGGGTGSGPETRSETRPETRPDALPGGGPVLSVSVSSPDGGVPQHGGGPQVVGSPHSGGDGGAGPTGGPPQARVQATGDERFQDDDDDVAGDGVEGRAEEARVQADRIGGTDQ